MNDAPELFDRAVMARALAYLFTGGAAVGLLTLALPHDATVDEGPLYGLAALAVAIGLAVLWRGGRTPNWALHAALATGSLMLVTANYFVDTSGVYLIVFTWTGLYAFYFFRPPVALAHLAVIGVAYAVVLAIQEPPNPIVRWALAIGTPGVAGLMVSTLLDRLRRDAVQAARQERDLRQSEARTRAIVESAPQPFLAVAEDGTVLIWNAACERVFGWPAAEALGRPIRELIIAPDDLDGHDRRREAEFAREPRETTRGQVQLVRRGGEAFPAEVVYSRVQAAERPMLACFITDLTFEAEHERRAEQLSDEQAAREEAEQMAGIVHGLQMLLDVALAHNRLDEMLEALLPRVCEVVDAEGAAILLPDGDGSLRLWASMFRDVQAEPLTIQVGEGIAGRVAQEKRPLLFQDPDPSEVVDPALHGLESILGVPLMAGDEVTGVLKVGVPAPRRFSEDDLLLLGLAADRVALAIDHLRVYEREHRIAETLQRSLLPERLPSLPGLEVAARYLPAASESEVGGDWYDVIAMPGGRVGLVMGDVAGKGLAAASMVGTLRSAMRAYALEGHNPAEVLSRLNELVWSEADDSHMTTLVYVVFDPADGSVRWVNAGHLPPLAITADGMARYLEGASAVPLGVMAYPLYEEAETSLPLGGTVLLYTDGLVERPGELLDIGLDRLVAAVRGRRVAPEELCDHVLDSLVPDDRAFDDVALLALSSPPLTDTIRLELGSDPNELAAMRSQLRRWLHNSDGDEAEVAEILTAIGEAAANAIEHGGAVAGDRRSFTVDGKLVGGEVQLVVRDSGSWRDRRRKEGGRGLLLMRALMDSVDVDTGSGGTTVRMRRRIGATDPPGVPGVPT